MYIENTLLPHLDTFKYLSSIISHEGTIDKDVEHRTITGWLKWRQLKGITCDNKIPLRVRGKVFKEAVRPAILHGSECWAPTKQNLNNIHTSETVVLRWPAGGTLLDKIRGSFEVAPIIDKLIETRRRWYGHVHRRPGDLMVKIALYLQTWKALQLFVDDCSKRPDRKKPKQRSRHKSPFMETQEKEG